ncbi:MAG TPA: 4Fe-4S binding protein [Dehalococcoidales bacterium]|nr:4Fe-4S binding protein [Dehalococcoidales bacterium]
MDTDTGIYRELQRYLDRLPSGFPAAASGLDIKLLQRFFTPEEAALAMQLSMKPEPLPRIYGRVRKNGMSLEELKRMLDRMLLKGTVLGFNEGYDETHYSNAEFTAGGIYNFQVDRLSPDLIQDYRRYLDETRPKPALGMKRVMPLRTVPVAESIPLPEKYKVSNYDSVRKLIEEARGQIAVANCICRQSQGILGEPCAKTDLHESCLLIGPDHARRHVDMGIARYISKEEALGIIDRASRAGLVLQPENSQRPEAICCCCGDCCILLRMFARHPRPVELYVTNYYAEVDPGLCTACEVCVEKCQLHARAMVDGVAVVNLDRCIGCGGCVVVCPSGANKLRNKEPEKVPARDKVTFNMGNLARRLGRWEMMKIRARMLLGLKV